MYVCYFRMARYVRETCPEVCNYKHLSKFAWGCHKRHRKFEWPAESEAPTAGVFSNSLCKFVNRCTDISVYSEMRLTVSKFYAMLRYKFVPLDKFRIVILHLGYDVNTRVGRGKTAKQKSQRRIRVIVKKYRQVVNFIRRNYPGVVVVLCSLVEKPKKQPFTRALNEALQKYAYREFVEFFPLYRVFKKRVIKEKQVSYFTRGKYLNYYGNYYLREYLTTRVKHLQNKHFGKSNKSK